MEQDDFAKLPGGVFTKSFVRQYANFLGLDGEELAAEMEQAAEPEPVSQPPNHHKPDVPGIDVEIGNWQSVTERRTPLPSWFRAGVLLVVLMLVCSGVYYWWQRPRHQVLAHETQPPPKSTPVTPSAPPVPRPAENPPAAAIPSTAIPSTAIPSAANPSAASPAAATPASTESSAQPAPAELAATPPVAAPGIPNTAPNPNAKVRVGITADEAVWIRADVNGKYQFSGVLQPHESRSIDVDGEVTLRLGNAGGASLTLNGKPVGAVGPKGQIRTVQFTSGGFQIVSPPKVLEPLDRL